jgi:uncharacterized membrane protein
MIEEDKIEEMPPPTVERAFTEILNWQKAHKEKLTVSDLLADKVAMFMGSWRFIIIQTVLVIIWMTLNLVGFLYHWDEYPFILLNLVFSTQAAYAAPIIMQSQNRQSERDRHHAEADYQVNLGAKNDIEQLAKELARVEIEKLDRIIESLTKLPKKD